MRILLIGEFSGVHINLKKGLEGLGHEVKLVSSGDSWKKIDTDDFLTKPKWDSSRFGQILNLIIPIIKSFKFRNYDIVQLITPSVISLRFKANTFFVRNLKKHNKKLFLIAAGCDSNYYATMNLKSLFKYSPCTTCKEQDLLHNKCKYSTKRYIDENKRIERLVDGVIPLTKSYYLSYKHLTNIKKVLPMPIFQERKGFTLSNTDKNKIVIFHGINRIGFKGTKIIVNALNEIKARYDNKVEIIVSERMPYEEYLKVIEKTDIIIDQLYSHATGMNGLISLSLGKVVLGGNEESFNSPGCPVINIKPNPEDIYNKLEFLIINPDKILDLKKRGIQYIENQHNYLKVTKLFLKTWSQKDED